MSLNLITDRSAVDYADWLALSQIPWSQMTEEQKSRWSVPMKGAYNYTDLNRVGTAILALQTILAGYGYPATVNVRTNWTIGERPSTSAMSAYIQSIANIRAVFPMLPTTPAAPTNMDDGTIIIWNNIEQILREVETLINNIKLCWMQSGEIFSGEV